MRRRAWEHFSSREFAQYLQSPGLNLHCWRKENGVGEGRKEREDKEQTKQPDAMVWGMVPSLDKEARKDIWKVSGDFEWYVDYQMMIKYNY